MEKLMLSKCGTKLMAGVLLVVSIGAYAWAQSPDARSISVEQPWARATPAGARTGAAYLTLTNNAISTERLMGATTPVAETVQFHKVTGKDGIVRMRELRSIDIASGDKLMLKPGNIHIMMVGLKQPLRQGQMFPLTLEFEKAGTIEVVVSVAGVGAMKHGMGDTKH